MNGVYVVAGVGDRDGVAVFATAAAAREWAAAYNAHHWGWGLPVPGPYFCPFEGPFDPRDFPHDPPKGDA